MLWLDELAWDVEFFPESSIALLGRPLPFFIGKFVSSGNVVKAGSGCRDLPPVLACEGPFIQAGRLEVPRWTGRSATQPDHSFPRIALKPSQPRGILLAGVIWLDITEFRGAIKLPAGSEGATFHVLTTGTSVKTAEHPPAKPTTAQLPNLLLQAKPVSIGSQGK